MSQFMFFLHDFTQITTLRFLNIFPWKFQNMCIILIGFLPYVAYTISILRHKFGAQFFLESDRQLFSFKNIHICLYLGISFLP